MKICVGGFDAKTRLAHQSHPHVICLYGKGVENSNDEELIQKADDRKIIICNPLFKHKFQQLTTWLSNKKNEKRYNNEPRKNQSNWLYIDRKASQTSSQGCQIVCAIELLIRPQTNYCKPLSQTAKLRRRRPERKLNSDILKNWNQNQIPGLSRKPILQHKKQPWNWWRHPE